MEAELTEAQREVLFERCARRGVALTNWHVVPGIARSFEEDAWWNLTQRMISTGVSRERAEIISATRLGLELSALQRREERYKAEAIVRRITKCGEYPTAA